MNIKRSKICHIFKGTIQILQEDCHTGELSSENTLNFNEFRFERKLISSMNTPSSVSNIFSGMNEEIIGKILNI